MASHAQQLGQEQQKEVVAAAACYEAWEPAERGWHLRASRDLRAGELVLAERPSVCMATVETRADDLEERVCTAGFDSSERVHLMCDQCGGGVHDAALVRCQRCFAVHYCSRACAERGAPLHEKTGECRAIVLARSALAARSAVLSEVPHRWLLRIMAMHSHKLANVTAVAETDGDSGTIGELRRRLTAHVPDRNSREYQGMTRLVAAIRDAVSGTPLGRTAPSVPELVEMMCVGIRNSHTLHASEQSVVAGGLGIYARVSALNHDCRPTCESYNVGNVVYVRTVERVAKGQELTICYVPEWFSLSRRKHELLSQYKFDCSCKRCAEQHQKQQQQTQKQQQQQQQQQQQKQQQQKQQHQGCSGGVEGCSKRKHEVDSGASAMASTFASCKRHKVSIKGGNERRVHETAVLAETTTGFEARDENYVDDGPQQYLHIGGGWEQQCVLLATATPTAAGHAWRGILHRAQAAIATAQEMAAHPQCSTRAALLRLVAAERLNGCAKALTSSRTQRSIAATSSLGAIDPIDLVRVDTADNAGDDGWRSRLMIALLGTRFAPPATAEITTVRRDDRTPGVMAKSNVSPASAGLPEVPVEVEMSVLRPMWIEGVNPLLSEVKRVLTITRGPDHPLVGYVRSWLNYGAVPLPIDCKWDFANCVAQSVNTLQNCC